MDLYLMFHSVLMHVSAAMVVLVYIPLSIPVKIFLWAFVKPLRRENLRGKVVLITGASSGIGEELAYQYAAQGACLALVARRKKALEDVAAAARERGSPSVLVLPADVSDADQSRRVVEATVAHFGKLNHLVANAGIWSICSFDDVTNITAFHKMMDVNFWGSVYPTYYALPHLKASRGKLVVSSSVAGTVATSRMSFYNATKAAQLRFYETLRAELGSEVGVTILAPGYVESEMTKGKGIQSGGQIAVNEEARDEQIGVFPVGRVDDLCEVALDGIRRGDWYITWPSLFRPLKLVAFLAPEVLHLACQVMYSTSSSKGKGAPLGKRIMEATGAKRLFPEGLRRNPVIKTEDDGECCDHGKQDSAT
uniref:3-oxoacyl-[acyl-carrier-protein] reductase n=1 Tax=Leersia perrieri TaxID=77586 RepID=A0A0D9VGB2_9ORYZ